MDAKRLCKLVEIDPDAPTYVRKGLRSGHPPCCVFWFAMVWRHITELANWQAAEYDDLTDGQRRAVAVQLNYVAMLEPVRDRFEQIPCPACLLKALAETG